MMRAIESTHWQVVSKTRSYQKSTMKMQQTSRESSWGKLLLVKTKRYSAWRRESQAKTRRIINEEFQMIQHLLMIQGNLTWFRIIKRHYSNRMHMAEGQGQLLMVLLDIELDPDSSIREGKLRMIEEIQSMAWYTKPSLRVISWKLQTSIHNLTNREICMKIDFMLRLVLTNTRSQRIKMSTPREWSRILKRCVESTTFPKQRHRWRTRRGQCQTSRISLKGLWLTLQRGQQADWVLDIKVNLRAWSILAT